MNMRSYNCCCQKRVDKRIFSLAVILKVVSEENRLKILWILKNGRHCVCEIISHLKLAQSLVSHHLADLKKTNLIIDKKEGRKVYYSLTDLGKKLVDLLSLLRKP